MCETSKTNLSLKKYLVEKIPIMMKIPLVLIIFFTIVTSTCYAMTTQPRAQEQPQIFVQIQIRDSQDYLVAYLEPTRVYEFGNINVISHYSDVKTESTFTKDGKKFEQIQFEEKGNFVENSVMTRHHFYTMGTSGTLVLTLITDGFPVRPGDSYDIWWTILVPAG